MKEIDISYCGFGDVGVKNIFKCLKKNSSLEILSFGNYYSLNEDLVIDCLLSNKSLKNLYFQGNEIKNGKIGFLLDCNKKLDFSNISQVFEMMKEIFFIFLLCLKILQNRLHFKIPKFILFEIIKLIDRISFLPVLFPEKQITIYQLDDSYFDHKKRKIDSDD